MFICDHCGRETPDSEGADDVLERVLGPICDSCWCRLPDHVHEWADGVEDRIRNNLRPALARGRQVFEALGDE